MISHVFLLHLLLLNTHNFLFKTNLILFTLILNYQCLFQILQLKDIILLICCLLNFNNYILIYNFFKLISMLKVCHGHLIKNWKHWNQLSYKLVNNNVLILLIGHWLFHNIKMLFYYLNKFLIYTLHIINVV